MRKAADKFCRPPAREGMYGARRRRAQVDVWPEQLQFVQPHEQQRRLRAQPQEQALFSDVPADEQPQVLAALLAADAPDDWQQGLQQELATKSGNTMPPQTVWLHIWYDLPKKYHGETLSVIFYVRR